MLDQVLIAPVVHMGGTSRDSLLSGYCEALDALKTAIAALRAIAPNARDFPGAAPVWLKACEQHKARVQALENVLRETTAVAEKVAH